MKENTSFLGSRTWKKFVNVAYNLGASVVIIGAMFKILHLPYGDLIIGIGMLSEAILFAITAIDPIGYDYHWEKVFPALVGGDKSQDTAAVIPISDNNIETSLSEKLDTLLSRAGIDASMMERLSEGMNRLSQEARSLSSLSGVRAASTAYSTQMNTATENLEKLNLIYTSHIEQMAHQESHIRTISSTMQRVAESSSRVSGSIERLATNLEALGSIYGNVLNAMNPSGRK